MPAALDDPAGVEHQHLVGRLGGRQPVRDGQRRPAAGQALERARQPHLGGRVDGRGRLVEHEQVRVGQVGPGQRHQLPLAGRQLLAALPDVGDQAVRQAGQPVHQAQLGHRQLDVLVGGRRDGRSGRCRGACPRRGSRPAAPCTIRDRSDANDSSRRSTPSTRTRPSTGSISRVSSFANVVLPEPVSPTTATRDRGRERQVDVAQHRSGRPGRRTTTCVEPHVDRAARQGAAGVARVGDVGGVSRTPRTRRQPATAFCASLSTSVPICTGPTNSCTRKRKASSSPRVSCAVDAEQDADHDDAGVGQAGDDLAGRERQGDQRLGPRRGRPVPVDRAVDAPAGALLDAVRPDGRRADDGLGDRAEQVAHALAHGAVRRGDALLEACASAGTAAGSTARPGG